MGRRQRKLRVVDEWRVVRDVGHCRHQRRLVPWVARRVHGCAEESLTPPERAGNERLVRWFLGTAQALQLWPKLLMRHDACDGGGRMMILCLYTFVGR